MALNELWRHPAAAYRMLVTALLPQRLLGDMYDDWLSTMWPSPTPLFFHHPGVTLLPTMHIVKNGVENVNRTACREPLMTRQTRTGHNAPAGYLISVSAVT